MNRREALAALTALPAVSRIATVPGHSDDAIVVECEERISMHAAELMRTSLREVWPHRKIVVLEKGVRIKLAPAP